MLVVFCLSFFIADASYGVEREKRPSSRPERPERERPQRQDRQNNTQNASAAGRDIDKALLDVLDVVNQGKKPTEQSTKSAGQVLQKARKFAKQFDDSATCQYYMLNSWLSYFQDELPKAAQASLRAYRKDPENNDARSTHTAMAILTDKKPKVLTVRKKTPPARPSSRRDSGQRDSGQRDSGQRDSGQRDSGQRDSRQRDSRQRDSRQYNDGSRSGGRGYPESVGFSGMTGMAGGQASSGNVLDFDADAVRTEMIGTEIGALELNCLNGTKLSYNPAEAELCILFWQQFSEDSSEPNDVSGSGAMPSEPVMPPMMRMELAGDRMGGPGGGAMFGHTNNNNTDPFSLQMTGFSRLFSSQLTNSRVKFVAINTDAYENKYRVMNKLLENPWPWAQVMANDPSSGASQFGSLDFPKPVVVIVSGNGRVKYAGPAAGFLAPLVLSHVSAADNTAATVSKAPVASESGITTAQAPPVVNQQQIPGQEPEEDLLENPQYYQAAKLLEYARTLFIPLGRKTMLTSKKGVELCREIITKYPETKYADEARMLLRKVPEHERKRYKITNEEMGL